MPKENVRVMLASEYPEVRHLLSELARNESGTVVVGQAENGIKATSLAKKLKPDVAVLDCHLPHALGLDAVPLSRVGGLDTALTIYQDVPNTQVILVGNLDAEIFRDKGLSPAFGVYLSRQAAGATIPVTLQEVFPTALQTRTVVFANVEARERVVLSQRVAENSDIGIWFGGLAIFGGLLLIGTMVFALPGAIIALAGAGAVFLGIGGRLTAALWLRVSLARGERRAKREQGDQGK